MNKQLYGQFYTTNYNLICENLYLPIKHNHKIIEPFCGNCDLTKLNLFNKCNNIELYDIQPPINYITINNKTYNIITKDTLFNPPNYKNSWIITNPPYLSRNKNSNKQYYNLYNTNDLYKCFIINLLTNICKGGILIIPLNFFCSIRNNDVLLRKNFMEIYKIKLLNIFEIQVFNDTSYTICSFNFIKRKLQNNNFIIKCNIYKNLSGSLGNFEKNKFTLNINNNYTFGGQIYNLNIYNNYKVYRIINIKDLHKCSNILVKCIDDATKINFSIIDNKNIYIDNTPNKTARSYCSLIIEPFIDLQNQTILVNKCNDFLNFYRNKYNSLFLTNFREFNRKRISFDLVYQIILYNIDFI
jgi:hypothetical protein